MPVLVLFRPDPRVHIAIINVPYRVKH